MVAQTQKVLFLCNCYRTTLVPSWTTKIDVVAQQVEQRRQSWGRTIAMVAQGLPWSPNGGGLVATVIVSRTLLVCQRRHNGGTRKAEALNMLKNSRHPWRGLSVICATFERPRQPFGLLCAFNADLASFVVARGRHKSCNPCLKGVWVTNLVGDPSATGQILNTFKTWWRPWRPWRLLNVLCTTFERPTMLPPSSLQRPPGQFCGHTREAQKSQVLCKGGYYI